MRKRLFNPHKIKRRFSRRKNGLRKISDDKRRYNPFHGEKDSSHRHVMQFALLIILILSMGCIFIFHSFFHIRYISVSGLQRINEEQFTDSVRSVIEYKKLGVLPAQSYIFTNTTEIADVLQEKYPLSSLNIEKVFPNTLKISLEEKISTIIFDNGSVYSYLGLDGKIVETLREVGEDEWTIEKRIATTTLADGTIRTEEHIISKTHTPPASLLEKEMGKYPIVFDELLRSTDDNADVILNPTTVANIITWYHEINQHPDISFKYIILDKNNRHATIRTYDGWGIEVNITADTQDQIDKLKQSYAGIADSSFSYIDVRYPSRVYWQ